MKDVIDFIKSVKKLYNKNSILYFVVLSITIFIYLNSVNPELIVGTFPYIQPKHLIIKNKEHTLVFFIIEMLLTSIAITRILILMNFVNCVMRYPIISDIMIWINYKTRKRSGFLFNKSYSIAFNIKILYWALLPANKYINIELLDRMAKYCSDNCYNANLPIICTLRSFLEQNPDVTHNNKYFKEALEILVYEYLNKINDKFSNFDKKMALSFVS